MQECMKLSCKDKIDFPVSSSYGRHEIKLAQKILLENATNISSLLESAGVKHTLAFGTLLGAVRHNGFVPWDDDFDFFVADEDYEDAITILRSCLPSHLLVHDQRNDENYFHSWARIKDLRTRVTSAGYYHRHNELLKYKCLSIDLYRLKGLRPDQIQDYLEDEALAFFDRKRQANLIGLKEFQQGIAGVKKYLEERNVGVASKGRQDFHRLCIVKMESAIPDEFFFPAVKVPFSNEYFYAPSNSKFVLSSLFGQYEAIPDYEDRLSRLTSFEVIVPCN